MSIAIVAGLVLVAYLVYFQAGAAAQTNETGVNVQNSTGSITGQSITADQSTWPSGDKIWTISQAIALAEGYDKGTGYAAFDLNNPGDISDGISQYGSEYHDGSNITKFPDAETGWQWLYNKLNNAASGKSSVYHPTDTWTTIAHSWAGDWQDWVNNVTSALGVSADSTLADYMNS